MLRYVCVMGPISDPTEFQWYAQLCTSRHTFTYKHHQLPIEILTQKINNKRPTESSKVLYSDHVLLSVYSFSSDSDLCYIYASLLVASPVQEARRRGGKSASISWKSHWMSAIDRNRFPVSMVHFELLEMDVSAVSKGFKTGFHQIYLDHFIKCESAALGDKVKEKNRGSQNRKTSSTRGL